MGVEIDQLKKQKTWNIVDLPPNRKALRTRWVYKIKTDQNNEIIKYKARWVVKGFSQQYGIDYEETFANTCRPEVYKMLLYLAAYHNWEIVQWDFKNAFTHADIDKELYVEQPEGATIIPNKVYKLNKALYGLKQSSRQWYNHLANNLKKEGFYPIFADQAVFKNDTLGIIILCHVDDLLVFGPKIEQINKIQTKLGKNLELTSLGPVSYFLGMEITRDRINKVIKLNQKKYTQNILQRFNKQNLNPVSTPGIIGLKLEKNTEQASPNDTKQYQQEVGSLIYLSTKTRPDIAFNVNTCARFMSNPNKLHYQALNQIWKYLNYTPTLGITYSGQSEPYILGYCDSDWGGDVIGRKSTSAYYFFFGRSPISWASQLQKTVALSSCEAEYMALKEAIKEYLYLISVIKQLNIENKEKFYLFTDSLSAIGLANNPEHHAKTKHIDIQYHFIREHVTNDTIQLSHISTKEQLADVLTKALSGPTFKYLVRQMNLLPIEK
jgi:hypothetical protein